MANYKTEIKILAGLGLAAYLSGGCALVPKGTGIKNDTGAIFGNGVSSVENERRIANSLGNIAFHLNKVDCNKVAKSYGGECIVKDLEFDAYKVEGHEMGSEMTEENIHKLTPYQALGGEENLNFQPVTSTKTSYLGKKFDKAVGSVKELVANQKRNVPIEVTLLADSVSGDGNTNLTREEANKFVLNYGPLKAGNKMTIGYFSKGVDTDGDKIAESNMMLPIFFSLNGKGRNLKTSGNLDALIPAVAKSMQDEHNYLIKEGAIEDAIMIGLTWYTIEAATSAESSEVSNSSYSVPAKTFRSMTGTGTSGNITQ